MRKITLLLFLVSTLWGYAQVKYYAFSPSVGTYTEIAGGTVLGVPNSTDLTHFNDQEYFYDPSNLAGNGFTAAGPGLPIGFDFTFNGYVYNRFGVQANGWIGLGSTNFAPALNLDVTNVATGLSSVKKVPEILSARIAPLSKDLQAQTGSELRFQTWGDAPNRVLIVQWKKYKRKGTNGNGDSFNFQVRLYETTNKIEFVYGSMVSTSNTAAGQDYQVGLRAEPFATMTNFFNRTSSAGWDVTTAGTLATDNLKMNNLIFPANGLTYAWTPNTCGDPQALKVNTLSDSSVGFSWSSYLPAPEGYEYIVKKSSIVPDAAVSGTSTSSAAATVTNLDPNTRYYIYVRSYCGSSFNPWVSMGDFRTNCVPTTSFWENFDVLTYDVNNKMMPDCWGSTGSTGTCYIKNDVVEGIPGSVPNCLYMSIPSSTEVYAHLPAVNNLQLGTHRLRFKACVTMLPVASRVLELGYVTDLSNMATFQKVGQVTITATTLATMQWFTITPTVAIPDNVNHLVLKGIGNSSGVVNFIIDDLIWEPKHNCGELSSIIAKKPTNNSVDLSWNTTGTETKWQYAYQVYLPNSAIDTSTLSVAGETDAKSVVVTGLAAGKSYLIWVRSKCGETDFGPWYCSNIIATACESTKQAYESFDSSLSIPNCWRKVGVGGSFVVTQAQGTGSSNALELKTINSTAAIFVGLPVFSTASSEASKIQFKMKSPKAGNVLKIGWVTDLTDSNTFTEIKSVAISSTANAVVEVNEALGTAPAASYLAFKFLSANSSTGTSLFIDDFSWEIIPSCPDAASVSINEITSNSLKLNWTSDGSVSNWEYVLGTSADSSPYGLMVMNFENPSVYETTVTGDIKGLSPSTSYKAWIRSNCNTGSKGSWVGPVYFTTTCAPVEGFVQNFDAAVTMPDCWGKVGSAGAVSVISIAGASNVLKLEGNTDAKPVVALPPVSNAGDGTQILRFKLSGAAVNEKLEVGFLKNIADPSSFIPLGQPFLVKSISAFSSESIELGFEPASQVLAFRNPGTSGTTSSVYIDNVIWEPLPTCLDIKDLNIDGITSNSLSLTWTKGGLESNWDYVIGASTVTGPEGLNPVKFASPVNGDTIASAVVSGLLSSTSYKIWVRSHCGSGFPGTWIGPIAFTTICAPLDVFTENFDSNGTSIPACWRKIGDTGTVAVVPVSGASAPNALALGNVSATGMSMVSLVPLSNAAAGKHRLRFKVKGSVHANEIQVGYLANFLDPNSFQIVETISCSTAGFETKSVFFGDKPTSQVLAFKYKGTDLGVIYIDDIAWEAMPTCSEINSLSVSKINGASAAVNWNKTGTETAWQYVVGPTTETNPDNLVVKNIADPMTTGINVAASIKDLAPVTNYNLWVRAKCGDNSVGLWSDVVTFKTICLPVDSYQENFNDKTALPSCWRKIGSGGSAAVPTSSGVGSSNGLILSSTSGSLAVVVMPAISNASAGTHRLRFKVKASYDNSVVEVGYLTGQTTFVPLASLVSSSKSDFEEKIVELGTNFTADELVFRKTADPAGFVVIDDVVWEPIPICPAQSNLIVNSISQNSAILSWQNGGVETAWQYVKSSSAEADPSLLTPADVNALNVTIVGNTVSVSLSDLTVSTAYKVWVRSKCSDTNIGVWFGPLSFTTLPLVPACANATATPDANCGNYATQISWTSVPEATGYKITVGTTSGGNDVLNKKDVGNVLTYSVSGNPDAKFYYTVTPYNISGDAVGCAEQIFKTNKDACYCISAPTGKDGLGITNVLLGASNFSVPNVTYANLTSKQVNLAKGANSKMNIAFSTSSVVYNANVWIDFDNDFVFEPSEIVFNGKSAATENSVLDAAFMLPGNAPAGVHRMRIGATAGILAAIDGCYGGANGITVDMQVNIVDAVINDIPSSATVLTKGAQFGDYPVTTVNDNATGSVAEPNPTCGTYNGADIWYSATVPPSGNLTFELKTVSGSIDDLGAAVYSGTPDNLSLVTCIVTNNASGKIQPKIVLTGRTPDENLYLRVWENGGDAFGSFQVAAYDSALGMDTFESNHFTFYPNPVTAVLNIAMDQEITSVEVMNIIGQRLISESIYSSAAKIDMTELPEGTYLVKVISGDESKVVKVVRK